LIQTIQIKNYNNMLGQIQHIHVPFQMLPFTTVSANYHSFSSYFQVQEWICMEMYLQPIDRGWTLANNRLISLKIDLPLANCSRKQTCDTIN